MTRLLWPHWPSLERPIASAKSLLLFLDYDGTLVPITAHPSKVLLPASTKRLIEQLTHQRGVRVVLISGRALRDLKARVGVPDLYYVGNHGLELQGDRLWYVNPVAQTSRLLLKRVARTLKASLQQVPGAWVEEKDLTLSLHWREVPPSFQRRFRQIVARCTSSYLTPHTIHVTQGKQVIEIRPPVQWGKGDVVAWLRRRLVPSSGRAARALLVYLGDDETDEEAFRVVNRSRGLSVFVGSRLRATAARWRVCTPRDVRETLRRILQARCKSTRAR